MAQKDSNPHAISVRLKHYNTAKTRFQIDHDERHGKQPAYVDDTRSHLNTCAGDMTAKDYAALMLQRRNLTSPKRAANMDRAAIMTGGIITFGHLAQSAVETLPPDEQDRMFEGIAVAIASELGNEVTGLSIHRDEAALHAHFQMPARRPEDGRLMSEVLSPAMTSKLQDLAAQIAQMSTPNVERGNAKADTKARNKPVKGLHRTAAIDLDELVKKRDAAAEKLAKNERLAEKARLRATESTTEADKALKRAKTYERRSEAAREALIQAEAEIERLRTFQESIRAENQRLAEEGDRIAQENGLKAATARKEIEELQTEISDLITKRDATIRAAEKEACRIRLDAMEGFEKARAEAKQIKAEATPERFRELEEENRRLHQALRTWHDFRDSMKATLISILGNRWEDVRSKINAAWSRDPKNPDRVQPALQRSSDLSGPPAP